MNPAPHGARRTAWLGLLGCLALAGCGGGSSAPSADTASRTSASSSPTASPSPTASSSPTPPAVKPASGRKVSLEAFTARTPQGFDYDNSLAKEVVFSTSRDFRQNLEYSDVTIYPGTSNAFAARLSIKNSTWSPKPSVAPQVTIDGASFYHLTGPVGDGVQLDEYGSVQGSRLIQISFELQGTRAARRHLVDSVLATVHLK